MADTATVDQLKDVAKTVSPVIQEWAKELLEWAKSGKGFVIEQAPIICKEIVTWGLVEYLIYFFLGLIFLAVTVFFFHKKAIKDVDRDAKNHDLRDGTVFMICCTIFGYVVSTIVVFHNLLGAAQVYFAPRVYLIEFLSQLVK